MNERRSKYFRALVGLRQLKATINTIVDAPSGKAVIITLQSFLNNNFKPY